jgi:hypothetical protein
LFALARGTGRRRKISANNYGPYVRQRTEGREIGPRRDPRTMARRMERGRNVAADYPGVADLLSGLVRRIPERYQALVFSGSKRSVSRLTTA